MDRGRGGSQDSLGRGRFTGDYDRCVRLLTEETGGQGLDVHGYCANLHHRALGIWPATHKKELKGAGYDESKHPRGPGGEWRSLGSTLDRLKQMPVGETYNHHGQAEVHKAPGNFYHVTIPPAGGETRVYDTPAGAHRAVTSGKHDRAQSRSPIPGPPQTAEELAWERQTTPQEEERQLQHDIALLGGHEAAQKTAEGRKKAQRLAQLIEERQRGPGVPSFKSPTKAPRQEGPGGPGVPSDFAVSQLKDLHTQYLDLLSKEKPGTDRYKAIKKRLDELTAQIRQARPARAAAALQVPALVTLPGVDILAAGKWKLASGEQTFTSADLRHAVEAAACPAVGAPVIKIGHVDPRFDGEPALGRVAHMALSAEGTKVTGDLAGMPGWLGAVAASAYPRRSIEGTYDFQCQIGHLHPFVITALALLGVTPPGVGVLGGLRDVAALYGVQAKARAAGDSWRLEEAGGEMTAEVVARAITELDVRRAYYDNPGVAMSLWITELQMDPAQLIVADEATSKVYRVPFHIEAGKITFGDAAEVSVAYQDIAAARGSGAVLVWASAAESRDVPPVPEEAPDAPDAPSAPDVVASWDGPGAVAALGPDPSPGAIKALFALPGATKSESSLPHHDVSGGKVGAANPDGCSAAIAAINGARGGLKGQSESALRSAYAHLASHLRSAGRNVPPYSGPGAGSSAAAPGGSPEGGPDACTECGGSGQVGGQTCGRCGGSGKEPAQPVSGRPSAAGPGIKIDAAGRHGAFTGTHSHPHAALGHQGGDSTHDHPHAHKGEGRHAHVHAAGLTEGGSEVEFTEDQMSALRSALGLGEEDDELTAEGLVTAAGALRERADARQVTAGRAPLPPGVITVEQEAWDSLHARVRAGEEYRQGQLRGERDQVIAAAVHAGKFSTNGAERWRRLWDRDPDGTREVIASLAPNVVPVDDIGSPGGQPEELDSDYNRLFSKDYVAATTRPGA